MADQNNNGNDKLNNRDLIFDWKNPSMSTSSTSRMQEDARRAREESRTRREQLQEDAMKERKEELLQQRRARSQEKGRTVRQPVRTRTSVRSEQDAAGRTVPSGQKMEEKKTAGKKGPGISLSPSVLRAGIIGAAALAVLILVIVVIRNLPGGTIRKVPLIDKTLPGFVTEDYLTVNSWSRPGIASGEITGIVIHYTASPGATAKETRDYFESLAESHETRASSHFVIGLDGEIITCVPLGELAYASNSRNMDTISVECCHPEEDGAFTEKTYESLRKLTKWLMERYGLESEDVLRHFDVTGKLCPRYFVDHPEDWEQFLADLEETETTSET